LEEELGGPLIYRDGKNSRLTALGQDVETEFRRMQVALRNVSQLSDNWALGRHRVLDIAVAPTVSPNAFTSFFLSALEQIPSVGIKIRALQFSEDTTEVLLGKYHACILPREPRPDPKLDMRPLF
jgi:DNA-binding transcriptional LysR family regulator